MGTDPVTGLSRPPEGLGDVTAEALASITGGRLSRQRLRRLYLPPTTSAPNQARGLLVATLDQWQVPHLREPAELVVSELVSNAVRHAGTELEVCIARHDAGVCIAVRDDNPDPPRPRRAGTGEGGRGLFLVNVLAYRWGWLKAGRTKLVWAFLAALAPIRPQLV